MQTVSVFIPVYQSEKTVGEVMDRVRAALADRYRIEFAIVDDASPDDSWQVIQKQAAEHGDVKALRHSSNKGHNHAFHTGLP